ncbi:MAG: ADP-ribosylglycohydrolase family protein [Planctomycetota bacterium]
MSVSYSIVAGALLGGAVGDAMGAPFEGLWSDDIPAKSALLSWYHEYHGYPNGQYTDDTQLTLATIHSIVENQEIVLGDVARSIAELWRNHSVIGPGGACTQAAERYLATGEFVEMGAPVGQAGNGTAMRTAAVGLWFDSGDRRSLVSSVAEISRLTHRDPRSVAGGVVVALAAHVFSSEPLIDSKALCELLAEAVYEIDQEFSGLLRELPSEMGSEDCRTFLAAAGQGYAEFSAPIISPFVVPTVLASLYSVLVCRESWSDAVTTAIKLGGDVDTLGAIVGALAGIIHGVEGIPIRLIDELQDSRSIAVLATRYHAAIEARST